MSGDPRELVDAWRINAERKAKEIVDQRLGIFRGQGRQTIIDAIATALAEARREALLEAAKEAEEVAASYEYSGPMMSIDSLRRAGAQDVTAAIRKLAGDTGHG